MFGRKKRKIVDEISPGTPEAPKKGLFGRLREQLQRTRSNLTEGLANVLLRRKVIDEDLLEELETQLLLADVGIEATTEIITELNQQIKRKQVNDPQALYQSLREQLLHVLIPCSKTLQIDRSKRPFVILVVGVNGVGKTTTIGKLARRLHHQQGLSVLIGAGDTFRAAAVEQLQALGKRENIPVIAQQTGADAASVLFDALEAAKARNVDVLIADTAGRLHTQSHLMEELKKIQRVLRKLDPEAPHETLLVLDAGTGQNALSQTREFHQTMQLNGIALTKMDGTAKGGILFALSKAFGLPIRFIGIGEGGEDLREFNATEFIEALFEPSENKPNTP